jgi:hypothetical protein
MSRNLHVNRDEYDDTAWHGTTADGRAIRIGRDGWQAAAVTEWDARAAAEGVDPVSGPGNGTATVDAQIAEMRDPRYWLDLLGK